MLCWRDNVKSWCAIAGFHCSCFCIYAARRKGRNYLKATHSWISSFFRCPGMESLSWKYPRLLRKDLRLPITLHKRWKRNEIDAFISWTKTSFPWTRAREWARTRERMSAAERANEWAVRASGRANGPVLHLSIPRLTALLLLMTRKKWTQFRGGGGNDYVSFYGQRYSERARKIWRNNDHLTDIQDHGKRRKKHAIFIQPIHSRDHIHIWLWICLFIPLCLNPIFLLSVIKFVKRYKDIFHCQPLADFLSFVW